MIGAVKPKLFRCAFNFIYSDTLPKEE